MENMPLLQPSLFVSGSASGVRVALLRPQIPASFAHTPWMSSSKPNGFKCLLFTCSFQIKLSVPNLSLKPQICIIDLSIWMVSGHFRYMYVYNTLSFPPSTDCSFPNLENGIITLPPFHAKSHLWLVLLFLITSNPSSKPVRSILKINPE